MRKCILGLVSFLVFLTPVVGHADDQKRWDDYVKEGDYLTALDRVKGQREEIRFFYQITAWLNAILGDEKSALKDYHYSIGLETVPVESYGEIEGGQQLTRASALIIRLARETNAILVNEAHHVSQHRSFMASLLPSLAEQGYRYFAVEALTLQSAQLLNDGGDLTWSAPLYVHDPMFAALLYTARDLGFTIVAYEQTREQALDCSQCDRKQKRAKREKDQATNIFEQIFGRDPQARAIVYAGFDHIHECEKPQDVAAMAAILKARLKGDPLSIDQADTPFYQEADKIPSAVLAMETTDDDACVDVKVHHPEPGYEAQRPRWLYKLPDRTTQLIDTSSVALDPPFLIRVRDADAASDTIPADQVLVTGPGPYAVSIPTGRFVRVTAEHPPTQKVIELQTIRLE